MQYTYIVTDKRKERQVAENECTMNTSGYESACTSTEERLIVNMKFPNRRSGARVRIVEPYVKNCRKRSTNCKRNTNVLYALGKE